MRSGEVARLAGVSVRTLRHYHQIGVLPEPHRRGGGYRDYDVHDLIRLLRIRRLASLGIPLERIPALLDEDQDAGDVLAELDGELADQIVRLTRQREVIAGLRAHGTAPDLPPELAPFLALFAASGSTADLSRIDRDQSILLAHLYGEEGMPWLTRFYARLAAPDLLEAGTDLAERFEALGDSPLAPRGATEGAPPSSDISTEARSTQRTKDASQQAEIETLVEEFMTRFAPVLEEFFAAEPEPQLDAGASMFTAYEADSLSDAQREVLARVGRRLD